MPDAYQLALQLARNARSDVAADRLAAVVSRGACPLVIERLQALSSLASLDAMQGASPLVSSTARPSGASDAC